MSEPPNFPGKKGVTTCLKDPLRFAGNQKRQRKNRGKTQSHRKNTSKSKLQRQVHGHKWLSRKLAEELSKTWMRTAEEGSNEAWKGGRKLSSTSRERPKGKTGLDYHGRQSEAAVQKQSVQTETYRPSPGQKIRRRERNQTSQRSHPSKTTPADGIRKRRPTNKQRRDVEEKGGRRVGRTEGKSQKPDKKTKKKTQRHEGGNTLQQRPTKDYYSEEAGSFL